MLTDTALKNLRPKTRAYKSTDRDGMYVYVSTGGAISFRYDYRFNGRRETMTIDDMALLEVEAARTGLSRTQWTVALIRRRLHERPQLSPSEAIAFVGIQRELRRIGVNVNQIARALNTAVLEGKVLDLEVAQLADFATEIRAHLVGVQDAFRGNLDYWSDR